MKPTNPHPREVRTVLDFYRTSRDGRPVFRCREVTHDSEGRRPIWTWLVWLFTLAALLAVIVWVISDHLLAGGLALLCTVAAALASWLGAEELRAGSGY